MQIMSSKLQQSLNSEESRLLRTVEGHNRNVIFNLKKRKVNQTDILDRIPYDKFMFLVDYSYDSLIDTVAAMEPELGTSTIKHLNKWIEQEQENILDNFRTFFENIIVSGYTTYRNTK